MEWILVWMGSRNTKRIMSKVAHDCWCQASFCLYSLLWGFRPPKIGVDLQVCVCSFGGDLVGPLQCVLVNMFHFDECTIYQLIITQDKTILGDICGCR